MSSAAVSASGRRISTLQSDLRGLNLNALVVTHLPNVHYLTGLSATAGIVVVREDGCTMVVDFRYETAAKALLESLSDHPYDLSVPYRIGVDVSIFKKCCDPVANVIDHLKDFFCGSYFACLVELLNFAIVIIEWIC